MDPTKRESRAVLRFFDKVGEPDSNGCWPWLAGRRRGRQGYGEFFYRGRGMPAHRWSYAYHIGPIPEGMWVLHHCDNQPCVNPAHLFVGDNNDNIADRQAKGRQARGEMQGNSKLTTDDVLAIRASSQPLGVIAERYGVSYTHVWRVRARVDWKHIQ